MSDLRDYILSKLEEKIAFRKDTIQGKAARASAAGALRAVKKRFQQSGLARRPGDAAKLTKQYSQETYKHEESLTMILADKLEEMRLPVGGIPRDASGRVSKNARKQVAAGGVAIARTGKVPDKPITPGAGGVVDLDKYDRTKWTPATPEQRSAAGSFAAKKAKGEGVSLNPRPERSSTDLRTQLMYILADKLDEVIKPDFRTQQTINPEDWSAKRKPKPATEPTSKPPFDVKKLINKLKNPNTSDKPSPKTSGATPYLMRGEQSSTILKDRMVDILMEAKRGENYAKIMAKAAEKHPGGSSMFPPPTKVPERGAPLGPKMQADAARLASAVVKHGPGSEGVAKTKAYIRSNRERNPLPTPPRPGSEGGHKPSKAERGIPSRSFWRR